MLDLYRFAVLALLLERSDECPAFDLFGGSEFSELVEDGRVAEMQLLSDLFKVELRVFALLLLLGVLRKDFIHLCKFLLSYGGPHLSILLHFRTALGSSLCLRAYCLFLACCRDHSFYFQLILQYLFFLSGED